MEVHLDGALRNFELRGDLLVPQPACNKFGQTQFSGCKHRYGLAAFAHDKGLMQDAMGRLGIDPFLPRAYRARALQQLAWSALLQHESAYAEFYRVERLMVAQAGGEQ